MSTSIEPAQATATQSNWQSFFIGSWIGASIAYLSQPFVYFKNFEQMQKQSNIAKSKIHTSGVKEVLIKIIKQTAATLSKWYRGGAINALSFAPIAGSYVTVNKILNEVCPSLCASTITGMILAVPVSPIELIVIQQQEMQAGLHETVRSIYRNYGLRGFSKGMMLTGGREGGYSLACWGTTPLLKKKFQSLGVNEWLAQGLAGGISGVSAAVATHPLDTAKTRLQKHISSPMSSTKAVFQPGAFAGLKWRIAIVTVYTTALPILQEKLEQKLWYTRKYDHKV